MDSEQAAAAPAVGLDELFADFGDAPAPEPHQAPVVAPVERVHRKDRLVALKAENRRLREEVRLLKRISSSAADVRHTNGPIAHMCFFNRRLSVESRRKIEDFILELSRATRSTSNEQKVIDSSNAATHWSTKCQTSAIHLTSDTVEFVDDEEDEKAEEPMQNGDTSVQISSASASMSTAGLAITGSIQAHGGFLIDTLGAPLVTDLPTASPCFEPPAFQRGFHHILPATQEEITAKVSRGGLCFNCSQPGHSISDCKAPRDEGAIQRNRQQFAAQRTPRTPNANRYHTDPANLGDGQRPKFEPGKISAELREALGLAEQDVPLHIYRMRVLGYPPAYSMLDGHKQYGTDKVKCTLNLYSGEKDEDEMEVDEPDRKNTQAAKIDYTPTAKESIRYPGFNCPLPTNAVDKSGWLGFPAYGGSGNLLEKPATSTTTDSTPATPSATKASVTTAQISSPVPVTITSSPEPDTEAGSSAPDRRHSAKFARGDSRKDGEDSQDETEDGEICSGDASPNVAVMTNAASVSNSTSENVAPDGAAAGTAKSTAVCIDDTDSADDGDDQAGRAPSGQGLNGDDDAAAANPELADSEQVMLIDLNPEPAGAVSAAAAGAPVMKRQWSTDFPPDMAPVEGELKHTWLQLRRMMSKSRDGKDASD
ncbi:zinc finger CCHC domain-containing protein 8-like [Sycon ciliatum]|uniref:zinc finger CCHC domain-containing protein 8-like n=1 Tax=Sycon ciliatum TaxID=27933 RepID=UPI0031F71088